MSGVVLAGGTSRRMGVDKATLRTADGETFLRRAVRTLAEAGADPVLVASGRAGRFAATGARDEHEEVDDGDRQRGRGPLAGILAALRRTGATTPVVAVLAVDLPDASPELLRWLRAAWAPGDAALVPLDPTGRPQPLHALWSTALADDLDDHLAGGGRRVLRFLTAAGARLVAPPVELQAEGAWARNVNDPGIPPTPGGLGQA